MITTFNDALQIIQNCKGITEAQLMARKADYIAEDIRMGIASGAPNKTLAETYGVSQQTICDIKHKRIYAGGNV